jgi:osmoprotectant transport system permease protein
MKRCSKGLLLVGLALIAGMPLGNARSPEEIRIGSKKFTESVVVATLAEKLAASSGARVSHRAELGGTRLLWDALLADQIDLYPEYTETLMSEILAAEGVRDGRSLDQALAQRGLRKSRPLGFGDAYALGMTPRRADERKRCFQDTSLTAVCGV